MLLAVSREVTVQGVLGIFVLLGIAWLLGERRREVRFLQVAVGIGIQIALAWLLLRVPVVKDGLLMLNHFVHAMETATMAGTTLIFGFLGGDEIPFEYAEGQGPPLVIFAFRVLPQILVFSVLVAVLWYWRILPLLIRGFAWTLKKTLGLGGAVGVAAASSVFLGLVESPLVIRAYLKSLSRSEFFVVITCGMSTVAGSIMVVYANVLGPVIDGALGHVLIASVVNVIGAVIIARIMVPEQADAAVGDLADTLRYDSVMDAVSRGTMDGLRLVANVASMVIVLVSLVALVNLMLGAVEVFDAPLKLERILGWAFAPVAWLMGVPWAEATEAGTLLGTKVVLNELIAYLQFAQAGDALSAETRVILTYALCGFANFGSLGILIGGISILVPDRRSELLRLGPRAVLSGTLVACLTGTIAGLVVGIGG